jgi:hypothetical protein
MQPDPTSDPKPYWRTLVHDLALPEAHQHDLLTLIDQVDPSHGVRAAMLSNYHDQVAAHRPGAVAAFDAFEAQLPKVPMFSFMPLLEVAARFIKAAQLIHPDQPLGESVDALAFDSVQGLKQAPFMRPMIDAAEGDIGALFEGIAQSHHTVENFGARRVERYDRSRVRLLYLRQYPLYSQYSVRGVVRGAFAWLGMEAEATFERLSDQDFAVEARGWR